eukprot:SAG22_NODE_4979_length_1117_cov_14.377210_1_plen_80_part_10
MFAQAVRARFETIATEMMERAPSFDALAWLNAKTIDYVPDQYDAFVSWGGCGAGAGPHAAGRARSALQNGWLGVALRWLS